MNENKPDCYKCVHRLNVACSVHSRCNVGQTAKVAGHPQGIRRGWFAWPINFDPVWLLTCDSWTDDPAKRQPRHEYDPLLEILAVLR